MMRVAGDTDLAYVWLDVRPSAGLLCHAMTQGTACHHIVATTAPRPTPAPTGTQVTLLVFFALAAMACTDAVPMGASVADSAGQAGGPEAGGGGGPRDGAAGCGDESFKAIYNEIFLKSLCAAAPCHGRRKSLELVANLDMSTPAVAHAALVGKVSDGTACAGRVRVTAGDAQNSLLVRKLRRATVDCGGFMPMDGEPIDDAALQRIVAWIDGGACNN